MMITEFLVKICYPNKKSYDPTTECFVSLLESTNIQLLAMSKSNRKLMYFIQKHSLYDTHTDIGMSCKKK